ncbi:MAG: glycosyltransferase [Lachnospiraceae bacterium]|nr:glycosyltransferase [Lachnospiraceae bacterium]
MGSRMEEPIRILHVLGGLSLGGAESRTMDLYRSTDRQKMQFDFLVHSSEKEHFDEEIEALGGRIYRVPRFKVYNWFSYKRALKRFFAQHHEFRAVHGHMTSTAAIYLPIAKKAGIPIVIGHARSAGVAGGLKGLLTKWLRRPLKHRADYCLACSKEAGEAVYGKKWVDAGRVEVVPNAVDAAKYAYDENVRNEMRRELGLSDKLVIGHVGSFREAKNHVFLIQIFAEIYKKRKDAVLLLLGDGALRETIEKQVSEAGLTQAVRFLGNQAKVSPYYQAMDYLVFPSLYEGLPGTVIEAQAAGLRVLVSDEVTKEAGVTELAEFFSLHRAASEWAAHVVENCEYERKSRLSDIQKAGFDISAQVARYEEIYRKNVLLMVPMLHQGGFERICVQTAKLLADKYNISIAIFSSEDMFYDVGDIPLIDLNLGSRPSFVGKLLNILRRIRAVKKVKKEKNIHVTYSFGLTANLINVLARAQDNVWIGIRGYGDLEAKRVMKLTCRRADKVICCAKEMADDVEKLYSSKSVECLYNPCDTEKLVALSEEQPDAAHCAFLSEKQPLLVSMSRVDDVKGFWHQIKAFALIKKEIPGAGLMIIGDGDFSEYEKLAEELQVRDSVLFTGVQKNPFCYLKRASLYLMTSETEGFPNAMLEAMAVGVPALSVNCKTGPAEILLSDYREADNQHEVYYGAYGYLLPIMNPNKNLVAAIVEEEERILAKEAVRLLYRPEELERMGQAAMDRSRYFSTDSYVSQIWQKIEHRK